MTPTWVVKVKLELPGFFRDSVRKLGVLGLPRTSEDLLGPPRTSWDLMGPPRKPLKVSNPSKLVVKSV